MRRRNFIKSLGIGSGITVLGPIAGAIGRRSRESFNPKKKVYIKRWITSECDNPLFRKFYINGRLVKHNSFVVYMKRDFNGYGPAYVFEEIFHEKARNNSRN